jgi:hypothetical protein
MQRRVTQVFMSSHYQSSLARLLSVLDGVIKATKAITVTGAVGKLENFKRFILKINTFEMKTSQ